MTSTLKIIYEDEHVIAVNKPAGLLSVPGRGPDKHDCVINRALSTHPNSRVVHRLDMATSGIILLAQSHRSQSHLSKQFQERQIRKHYCAVVSGELDQESGEIELPLMCDWPNRPRQMVCKINGKPAKTQYQITERTPYHSVYDCSVTRVRLTPITGRSHQLRVHMQAIGHPILGDYFYAEGKALNASERLLLHAEHIAFAHPEDGRPITLNCPAEF